MVTFHPTCRNGCIFPVLSLSGTSHWAVGRRRTQDPEPSAAPDCRVIKVSHKLNRDCCHHLIMNCALSLSPLPPPCSEETIPIWQLVRSSYITLARISILEHKTPSPGLPCLSLQHSVYTGPCLRSRGRGSCGTMHQSVQV